MRYRVHPLFWDVVNRAGMTIPDLAGATPYTASWLYRLKLKDDATVPKEWKDAALAVFPEAQRPILELFFEPAGGRERYTIRPELWGLLAMKRIKLSALAEPAGITAQRVYQLRSNAGYTVDADSVRGIMEFLRLTNVDDFFVPATTIKMVGENQSLLVS